MEDFEQVMLIVAAVQGLLLSIVLFISGWRQQTPAVYLSIVLFVFAIELLNAWAMGLGYHGRTGAFPFWTFGSYLLLPPSLWFFLRKNSVEGFRTGSNTWLWFIPAVFEIIVEIIAYYIERSGVFGFLGSMGWIGLTEYLPIFATLAVLAQAGFLSDKPKEQRLTKLHFGRQQWLLFTFMALVILWVIDALFHINVYHFIELILCTVLLVMGYIVYFNPAFFEGPALKKTPNVELFAGYNDEACMQRLNSLFNDQKIFLRPRLTLEELSAEMSLPLRYVSYLINHIGKSNFNQFVNSHRVEEVLRRMEDPQNKIKTLLGIALDSGFNSKSSFNTAFKAVTGKAPSTFLKDK